MAEIDDYFLMSEAAKMKEDMTPERLRFYVLNDCFPTIRLGRTILIEKKPFLKWKAPKKRKLRK